jgi:hypothetical protein
MVTAKYAGDFILSDRVECPEVPRYYPTGEELPRDRKGGLHDARVGPLVTTLQ